MTGARPDGRIDLLADSELEERLCAIYGEVLGVRGVAHAARLVDLGGDSIAALQIALRIGVDILGADGVNAALTAEVLTGSIREVARAARAGAAWEPAADDGPRADVPLLPDQAWFLEEAVVMLHDPCSWVQSRYFRVPADVDVDLVAAAVRELWWTHGALRATFHRSGGRWRQHLAAAWSEPPLDHIRLESPADLRAELGALADWVRAGLDLECGPLARFALVEVDEGPPRLLMMAHHLVCDDVSFAVLTHDLERAYLALEHGDAGRPLPAAPFAPACEAVHRYAHSQATEQELGYWLGRPWQTYATLPVDRSGRPANVISTAETVETMLDAALTDAVLKSVPRRSGLRSADVVLAAIGDAITSWAGGAVAVKAVNNGRGLVQEGRADVVGRFATSGVITLPAPSSDGPRRYLEAIRQSLDTTPNDGVGYSLLRWISHPAEITRTIETRTWRAEVLVNYLASIGSFAPPSLAQPTREPAGSRPHPADPRFTLLDITAGLRLDKLVIEWTFSRSLHRRHTIEALARRCEETLRLLAHEGTG